MYSMVDKLKSDTNEFYQQLIKDPTNNSILVQCTVHNEQLHSIMRQIEIDNEQKMIINWLTQGYKSTEFCSNKINVIKLKRWSNFTLNDNGLWISKLDKLAHEAINYFSNLFLST